MALKLALVLAVLAFPARSLDVEPPPPSFSASIDRELTVTVEAGKEDCYYETVQEGDVIDLDYQVNTSFILCTQMSCD